MHLISRIASYWFLEASKLLDVDVVSDQQSSESRFKAPISSSSFQKFLDLCVPLTPQSYCMVRLECSTHGRNGETSSQGQYMHDLHVINNREMNYRLTHFMHEVRRQDGKPYPPSTMQQIIAGLQRSVHEYHSVAGHLTTVNFRRTTLSLVCTCIV